MVQHSIKAAYILVAEFTKTDSQEVCPRQHSRQLTPMNHRQVMHPRLLKQLPRL